MTPKERTAMQQALEALERWRDWDDDNNTAAWSLDDEESITALREALKVTEDNINHRKLAEQANQEPVGMKALITIELLRQIEKKLIDYALDVEYEWGNCRPLEVLEEKKLLPEEVYSIREVLKDGGIFGFSLHTSNKPLHHFALVLRDLDKTIEGWCEKPEFYLDGELVGAPQPSEQGDKK